MSIFDLDYWIYWIYWIINSLFSFIKDKKTIRVLIPVVYLQYVNEFCRLRNKKRPPTRQIFPREFFFLGRKVWPNQNYKNSRGPPRLEDKKRRGEFHESEISMSFHEVTCANAPSLCTWMNTYFTLTLLAFWDPNLSIRY